MGYSEIDREVEVLKALQAKWIEAANAERDAIYKHGMDSIEYKIAASIQEALSDAVLKQDQHITDLSRR